MLFIEYGKVLYGSKTIKRLSLGDFGQYPIFLIRFPHVHKRIAPKILGGFPKDFKPALGDTVGCDPCYVFTGFITS